jgi:drug/metabolite transporter (DMT)-like permease
MPYLGEIAALATAVCWSLCSIAFTAAAKRIGPLQVNLYRLPMAIILIAVTYTFVFDDRNISLQSALWLVVSGVIGLAIGDTFLFQAFVMIGSRLSMLLLSLTPPMTAILAYFFLGEIVSSIGIFGILMTIAGVSWVVAERTSDSFGRKVRVSWKGIFFAVMAAVSQAVGLILAKKGLIPEMNPLLAALIRILSAGVILWPFALLMGKVKSPRSLFSNDNTALKMVIAGAILGPFLGVTLSLISVKYTDTGVAATLMSIVPVLMIPLVLVLEKEHPSWRAVLGAAIAVGGVALIFLR